MIARPFSITLLLLLCAFAAAGQTAEQHLAKCDASYAKDKYRDAIKHCTRAIDAKPGYEEAYMARAAAYEKAGDNGAAIADYSELIRLTNGMAMFHFYRAGIFQKLSQDDKALPDLTAAIAKEPTGHWAARAYYQRGVIYDKLGKTDAAQADYAAAVRLDPKMTAAKQKLKYPFGDLTISEAADRIVPGVQTPASQPTPRPTPVTVAKPAPSPTPIPKYGPNIVPRETPVKLAPMLAAVTVPASWKRSVLTGTGVSVASPMPYVLKNDKPDPLLEAMEANIDWQMSDGGLWATVRYNKWNQGYKKVRQHLEDTVNVIFNNPKAIDLFVIDTTFLGEPAAYFDETRFDTYENKSVRQKMLVFGKPNDYVTINFVHPSGDAAAAAKVDQILASFKKEGTVAAGVSKLPPTDWKTYNFGGLLFEFPAAPSNGPCTPPALSFETKMCGKWGTNDMTIDITYRNYGSAAAPQPSQMAAQHLQFTKEIEARDTGYKDYKTEAYPINAGEAVKFTNTSAFSRTDTIFIRRGAEIWQVRVWHFNRWDGVRDAVKRVVGSLKFK